MSPRAARSWAVLAALAVVLVPSGRAQVASPRVTTRAGAPAGSEGDGAALLATVTTLAAPDMEGRAAGTPGGAKARVFIEQRLKAMGAPSPGSVRYSMPFQFTTKAGAAASGINLVAECKGRRASAPVIVVSAHYDHLGIRDGQTYHGADDNASGVALLLHVLERCLKSPFQHTIVAAFFDAEETGLQGAHAFVKAPPIPVARIALNVNFDMVSRSDKGEIYVAGPGRWPKLAPVLAAAAAKAPVTVKFGHDTGGGQDDWTTQSDHGVFHAAGVPFVYFGVEDHPDYHRPTDTVEKISPDFLGRVAATVMRALAALDVAKSFK